MICTFLQSIKNLNPSYSLCNLENKVPRSLFRLLIYQATETEVLYTQTRNHIELECASNQISTRNLNPTIAFPIMEFNSFLSKQGQKKLLKNVVDGEWIFNIQNTLFSNFPFKYTKSARYLIDFLFFDQDIFGKTLLNLLITTNTEPTLRVKPCLFRVLLSS